MAARTGQGYALTLFDVPTCRQRGVIPVAGAISIGFLPNGRLLVNALVNQNDQYTPQLQWWDPATVREVASFAGDKDDVFYVVRASPDGRTVAALTQREGTVRLLLFRSPGKTPDAGPLLKTAKGEMLNGCELAFSPDGKLFAVLTQTSFPNRDRGQVDVRELPQPAVRVIDVATGQLREKLVCPAGLARAICFSSDGAMLATGGHGRVLLWDLSTPPLLPVQPPN
jgi:hypothetical protein